MTTIYGAILSPFVRKVLIYLEERNLPHILKFTKPRSEDSPFRDISPEGMIPAMEDGEAAFPDSSVICSYLEAKYTEGTLDPKDPAERGRLM